MDLKIFVWGKMCFYFLMVGFFGKLGNRYDIGGFVLIFADFFFLLNY